MSLYFLFSKTFLSALKPTSWGMLAYSLTTSAVTTRESLGISIFLTLLIKSYESLMYDAPFCTTLFR